MTAKMTRRLILAIAIAAGSAPAALPIAASAQTCPKVPFNQQCYGRLPQSQVIDFRQPGVGGSVGCAATTPDNVQFDYFFYASGNYGYFCTVITPCAALPAGNVAKQAFC